VKDKLPADLPVHNFTSDWNNGKAVGALVDSVAPGLCPDWEDWDPNRPLENAREAMDLADQVPENPLKPFISVFRFSLDCLLHIEKNIW